MCFSILYVAHQKNVHIGSEEIYLGSCNSKLDKMDSLNPKQLSLSSLIVVLMFKSIIHQLLLFLSIHYPTVHIVTNCAKHGRAQVIFFEIQNMFMLINMLKKEATLWLANLCQMS
jgi:hypothetical protein